MKIDIFIPRLSVNDDSVVLGEWLVNDNEYVENGQAVAVLETTKETMELNATESGYFHIIKSQGTEYLVGEKIAVITDSLVSDNDTPKENKTEAVRQLTNKAKKLIDTHHIDIELFPKDKIINSNDVKEHLYRNEYQIAKTTTNHLVIYGAGGFAHIIIDLLSQNCVYKNLGIIDMAFPKIKDVRGIAVLGDDKALADLKEKGINKIINAVDFPNRKLAYEKIKNNDLELPNLVHKSASIEPSVEMGEGNLIFANAMVGSEVHIGNNCVINAGTIINHECIISDHCHIASGAILAGCVSVGENTMIGQGVTIYQRVKIGRNVVIQNGCNIFSDVPDGAIIKDDK